MTGRVGYARVSTVDQNPQLQLDALQADGVVRIFTDTASGATTARPQLQALLAFLRPGDTLVVWKLDRLGRSLRDLINLLADLEERGVMFRSITDGIDTSTPAGKMMLGIFGALAEYERDLNIERTHGGLAAARAQGRVGGRPTVMTPARLEAAQAMRDQGKTLQEIAETLGVSRPTVVRHLKKALERETSTAPVPQNSTP